MVTPLVAHSAFAYASCVVPWSIPMRLPASDAAETELAGARHCIWFRIMIVPCTYW